MSKKWNEEEDEIIRAKYPSATWEELLALLPKRSKHTIYIRARKLDVKRNEILWKRQRSLSLSKETLTQLYYIEGKSLGQIGEIFGCCSASIANYMEMYGLKRRKAGASYANKTKIENLTEGEKGYLAGILDGEGTISINNKTVAISIGNTNKSLMVFLSSILKIGTFHKRGKTTNSNSMYGIAISSCIDVYKLLTMLLPYLIVKRKEAIKAIDYCVNTINNLDNILFWKLKKEKSEIERIRF